MPPKIVLDDLDYFIKEYFSGKSVKWLATQYGTCRQVIVRILNEHGITQRNRSQSMFNRMAQLNSKERKQLSQAAHDAVRGMTHSEESKIKRAFNHEQTKIRKGWGENQLITWLQKRSYKPIWQKAVNIYNIDIAIPPVAVELLIAAAHPLCRPSDRKKIEYLTNHGWFVLYICLRHRRYFTEAIADYIVFVLNSVKRDPSLVGQYWVVRGAGKKYSPSS